jgi:hypothetical protein
MAIITARREGDALRGRFMANALQDEEETAGDGILTLPWGEGQGQGHDRLSLGGASARSGQLHQLGRCSILAVVA